MVNKEKERHKELRRQYKESKQDENEIRTKFVEALDKNVEYKMKIRENKSIISTVRKTKAFDNVD